MELLNPPVIVGEQQAGHSASIRKQLMLTAENQKELTFDLAELLYIAKQEGLYRQWGYHSIGEYGEIELDLKYRKTQYLCRVIEVMKAVNIERKEYEPIGITKLREITRLDPTGTWFNEETEILENLSEHIQRLMKEAENLTATKIANEVNRLLGLTAGNSIVIRSYNCTQDAYEKVIKPGMEIIRRKYGDAGRDEEGRALEISDGRCIELAFAEVLSDPNNDVPAGIAVESDVAAITEGDIPLEEPTI